MANKKRNRTSGKGVNNIPQQAVKKKQKQQYNKKHKFDINAKAAKRVTSNLHPDTKTTRHEYQPLNLYPTVAPVDNSDQAIRATHPTPDNFKATEKLILENFTLIKQGRLMLYKTTQKLGTHWKYPLICTPSPTSAPYAAQ
ncbi:hypothetical protein PSHT_12007 [Puccinia striiformis]|uniref:Uncharacterized protein n=3 Tax=Puccinia striiformis TaxID=27350 RepID=A0A0L0VF02_9BASI|nr:hypothetical protein PSTG_09110 [Puccinia striiformis f. sp. tritici PST-78]POW02687.1 hypothetical protein PSHT_12007 [Puccinia striiformis]